MTVPFSVRESIELVDAIWGSYGSDTSLRDKRLKALVGNSWAQQITPRDGYFTVVAREISPPPDQSETPILSLKILAKIVRVLKSNPHALRQDLEFHEDVRAVLRDEMVDRTLSIMLMTESTFSGTSHQAIFNPRWRMNESLEAFIHRVYGNPQDHCDDYSPIKTTKLSVAYFRRRHVQVEISWTENLTDHLALSNNNKTLHVFKYPGFLQTGLDAAPAEEGCDSIATSLQRGCLPSKLLAETMWTYDIIFPKDDRVAQSWLKKQLVDHNLDTMLSRRPPNPQIHESPMDIGDLQDVRSLCCRYPYWGERLYRLWREVNEPSLVESRFEAYTKPLRDWTRANPSISWLSGVISGCVAVVFGGVGGLYSALQYYASKDGSHEQITARPRSYVNKIGKSLGPRKERRDENYKSRAEDSKVFEEVGKIYVQGAGTESLIKALR